MALIPCARTSRRVEYGCAALRPVALHRIHQGAGRQRAAEAGAAGAHVHVTPGEGDRNDTAIFLVPVLPGELLFFFFFFFFGIG